MNIAIRSTAIGAFDSRAEAEHAISCLLEQSSGLTKSASYYLMHWSPPQVRRKGTHKKQGQPLCGPAPCFVR